MRNLYAFYKTAQEATVRVRLITRQQFSIVYPCLRTVKITTVQVQVCEVYRK